MHSEEKLLHSLCHEGWLKTPYIIEAFRAVHRIDFVPDALRPDAYVNSALPIGEGQTISQPLVVAFMLELLAPKTGDTILEVGYGSGWQTSLLAHIVGEHGRVYAIEIVDALCRFGKENVNKYHFIEQGIVECFCQDGRAGLPAHAPFDGIIAAATAQGKVPDAWRAQLKRGGRIVAPIGESIVCYTKHHDDTWKEREYPGFVFVPLVGGNA